MRFSRRNSTYDIELVSMIFEYLNLWMEFNLKIRLHKLKLNSKATRKWEICNVQELFKLTKKSIKLTKKVCLVGGIPIHVHAYTHTNTCICIYFDQPYT